MESEGKPERPSPRSARRRPTRLPATPQTQALQSFFTPRRFLRWVSVTVVLLAAAAFGIVGWRYSVEADAAARDQARLEAFAQATALHTQIAKLTGQIEALDAKARLLTQYSDDILNGHSRSDWVSPAGQAAALTQDRDRLLREIGRLQWQLRQLAHEVGDPTSAGD